MAEHAVPAPKRRRGRPRGGATDARERIVAAAVAEFGERGYDGATMRGIAARAEVDAALLHHYFGTKADLFAAAVDVPIRPDRFVPQILAGPREAVGEGIVRFLLGPSGCGKTTLLRSIVGVQRLSAGDITVLGAPAGSRGSTDRRRRRSMR